MVQSSVMHDYRASTMGLRRARKRWWWGYYKPAKLPNDRPQLESHSWMFLRTFPAVVVETKAGVFRGELGELSFCDRDDQIRYFKPNQSGVTGQKQKIQPEQT